MAYATQSWVNGTTPLDASHMNYMETGILNCVDADAVVAAASALVVNKLLVGDAQPSFRILGDGAHAWGPGGSTAPDTNLYRSAVGNLKTDGAFLVGGNIQTVGAGELFLDPGNASKKIFWGSAFDTNLYRSAVSTLRTDGAFYVSGGVVVDAASGANKLYFGGALDTSLYRHTGGGLQSDNTVWLGKSLVLDNDNAAPSTNALFFGSALDTSLYRHAAGYLRTVNFVVNNESYVDFGNTGKKLYLGSSGDCSLYRTSGTGAGIALATDNALYCQGIICRPGITGTTPGSKFIFNWTGTSYDAYIDNTFIVSIYSSDARNKKSIKKLPSTWDAVKKLNPVSFKYKTQGVFKDSGRSYVGFLAQEVQALIPEGADVGPETEDGDGLLSLNLNAIVASLTKALQEAMDRIETLEGVTKPA